mmetsp:Transcript_80103/g.235611  ORF Transcript_80103/g.235611 Transcript_80103/m.235611 type:complete len:201 (+) Transcript_80103:1307-1909(+)
MSMLSGHIQSSPSRLCSLYRVCAIPLEQGMHNIPITVEGSLMQHSKVPDVWANVHDVVPGVQQSEKVLPLTVLCQVNRPVRGCNHCGRESWQCDHRVHHLGGIRDFLARPPVLFCHLFWSEISQVSLALRSARGKAPRHELDDVRVSVLRGNVGHGLARLCLLAGVCAVLVDQGLHRVKVSVERSLVKHGVLPDVWPLIY